MHKFYTQIDLGFSVNIKNYRPSISVGQMALLLPFEIVLIDAATAEHFFKEKLMLK